MNRLTKKQFEAEVEVLNQKLKARNHEFRFVVGYRYNYAAIDLATPEQIKKHGCNFNLTIGNKRQCLAECYKYIAKIV